MNIRSVSNFIQNVGVKAKEKLSTKADRDRDSNLNSDSGENQDRKRKLTEEEVQEAIKHLKELPPIKDNNFNVRLSQSNGSNVVYIEDYQGKVVRRIPESELGDLNRNTDQSKGHLLNKTY